ncbi:T9SS type A sorting domain-containing protein [Polluticoccus soli]|uniref:T9SS type A sorting domain-containing protein n=1 Tax=Polluticoccus soli TaxID=3034150 RepID=UPI0023E0BA7D|nr:T9SS type A sorting domain-containing protein [Flavipsychrobacter sp. JY13-12]
MKKILLSTTMLVAASAGYAQPGTLDASFGTGGKVEGNFGQYYYSKAYATAIQPDGKILVAGELQYAGPPAATWDFLVARYNPDGTLDNTFSGDGWAKFDCNSGKDIVYAMKLQPDGKILLAGTSIVSSQWNSVVFRVNADGSQDIAFGTNGWASWGDAGAFKGVALYADGRIAAGGSSQNDDAGFVRRFSAGGVPDGNFMPLTGVGYNIGINNDLKNAVNGVAVHNDGKVTVTGWGMSQASQTKFGFLKVKADGSYVDNTFYGSGVFADNSYSNLDRFYAMTLQPDGKILAAGMSGTQSGLTDFVLMRFDENGYRDNSFGNNGVARAMTLSSYNVINAIALQNDGRVVVAGATPGGSGLDFALLRFNPNGSLDNSFDGDGKATTSNTGGDDLAYGVAIQSDGKIVAAGFSGSQPNYTLVRYLGGDGVNVNEIANNASLKVYPNPGSGLFVMQTANADVAYTVTDINGRIVSTGLTAKGQTTVDLTKNANGIYLLQIENETVKLVKQ